MIQDTLRMLQESQVLGMFLDSWLDRLDSLIQTDRKKLNAMALASLITTDHR